ncbi:amidohydrolase family protein [Nannocystaceae bacterium ST9]
MSAERLAALTLALTLLACGTPEREGAPQQREGIEEAPPRASPDRLDAHVHLVDDAGDELLAALDRQGIAAAVVVASPHLDPRSGVVLDDSGVLPGWRAANDRILADTAAHRDRLLPFVTVEPAEVELDELAAWFERGACGVKLYAGHQRLHARPLDDPANDRLFDWLEAERVPLLLHVNTVRFRDELAHLLREHPDLELVCAHLCGSRTDLDRLAGLLREFPRLRVDTSHGAGVHGVEGFTAIEGERERLRAMILAEPERFVFGSDLVTVHSPLGPSATAREWDLQLAANLGLIERDEFEFWRRPDTGPSGGLTVERYQGLALEGPVRDRVLAGNAREWLGSCGAGRP